MRVSRGQGHENNREKFKMPAKIKQEYTGKLRKVEKGKSTC